MHEVTAGKRHLEGVDTWLNVFCNRSVNSTTKRQIHYPVLSAHAWSFFGADQWIGAKEWQNMWPHRPVPQFTSLQVTKRFRVTTSDYSYLSRNRRIKKRNFCGHQRYVGLRVLVSDTGSSLLAAMYDHTEKYERNSFCVNTRYATASAFIFSLVISGLAFPDHWTWLSFCWPSKKGYLGWMSFDICRSYIWNVVSLI